MSKILIIYYSLSGNVKFIAETIAQTTGADLLELKLEKSLKAKGFLKYLRGGKQVIMKEMPKLLPLDKNPDDYDLLFIGTPVWAWNFSPPLRSFLNQVKLQNKKVGLFCCNGGQVGKTLTNMKKKLNGNEILGTKDFFEPLKNKPNENAKTTIEWSKKIVSSFSQENKS